MTRFARRSLLVGLGGFFSGMFARRSFAAQDPLIQVPASEILSKVAIIGDLQSPLWQMVKVVGKWEKSEERGRNELLFVVSSVDGKPLKQVASFQEWRIRPLWDGGDLSDNELEWRCTVVGPDKAPTAKAGATWELFGFETGAFEGGPKEVFDLLARLQSHRAYGLITRFVFVSAALSSNAAPAE